MSLINAVFHVSGNETCHVTAEHDQTLMRAAKQACVPGIDADCGGSMVCGTCHVIVAPIWLKHLPEPSEMEAIVLEGVPEPHPQARLSCQIRMHGALDGIEVTVPATQR
jgi:2Fe-2S ferredoxin